ncbi:MAG: FAD-dependent oxidoreductase [Bacteroidales bacterium]|nr:FAD-dependent oxidoreductase [Bacteroidales bacterium]
MISKIKLVNLFTMLALTCFSLQAQQKAVDVLVIGGGASGTAASVESARLGVKTLLVEESGWLGGMLTGAGVSAIDGNHRLPGGFWGEFRDSLAIYYGSNNAMTTGWVSYTLFEPSVGNEIFQKITQREKNLSVYFNSSLQTISRQNGFWIASIKTPNGVFDVKSKILIDATELGDVAKMCGVKYDIGMEDRHITGEPAAADKAHDIIQDLTYVAILKDFHKDVSILRPVDYDSTLYINCCINPLNNISTGPDKPTWTPQKMLTYGKLPNDKYMINWPGYGNDYYLNIIEMTPEERVEALKKAKSVTMGFVYFIQKELGMNTLGLADDEYPTFDKLPFIPYHRESRRIHGLVRFKENHILNPYTQSEKLYRTTIAVGDYPVDHHHNRYTGEEKLPDLSFHPVPSYGLPLGTLIPQNVDGLIVAEKSISVSNIVNGTTRLQPVVLQIGQAAGTLAALSVLQNKRIDEVGVRDVQNSLLKHGGYILPYLDVQKDYPAFLALQHIGSTGILKGEGKSVDWSNETWFKADSVLKMNELDGLTDVYPYLKINKWNNKELSWNDALRLLEKISKNEKLLTTKNVKSSVLSIYKSMKKGGNPDLNHKITRLEMAVLMDKILDPFNNKQVNIYGKYIKR